MPQRVNLAHGEARAEQVFLPMKRPPDKDTNKNTSVSTERKQMTGDFSFPSIAEPILQRMFRLV